MAARLSEDRRSDITLVIAHFALLKRWEKEFDTKLERGHKMGRPID